jgi:hypothetical protein
VVLKVKEEALALGAGGRRRGIFELGSEVREVVSSAQK